MESILAELFGKPVIVIVLCFLIYWITSWIKLVLKDKLQAVWIQPIVYTLGTCIASLVMYNYSFIPLDLGEARFMWMSYLIQGAALSGLTGFIYDKYLDKE